jgi:dihydrodipicolinate reductase
MTPAVRVAIAGAGGKMGQALIEAVLADSGSSLVAAFDVAKRSRGPTPASGSAARPAAVGAE